MTKLKLALASCIALGTLAACTTATPYGPATPYQYGFSETQIETNRYSVSFAGNSLTDLKTVETYLLYRSAELTRSRGYDYFIVVDRKVDEETDLHGSSMDRFGYPYNPAFAYHYYHPRHGWAYPYDPFFNDVTLREVTKYEAIAEIVMGKGPKPAGDVKAYDAGDVLMRLAPQIQRVQP